MVASGPQRASSEINDFEGRLINPDVKSRRFRAGTRQPVIMTIARHESWVLEYLSESMKGALRRQPDMKID
jgi:hypothetical protein